MKGLPEAIDRLMAIEFRHDGVIDGVIDPLYRAARLASPGPLAWHAAGRLKEAAKLGRPIYVSTGFVHGIALPKGETDGPPGAIAIARALVLSSFAPVTLLCEEAICDVLEATANAAGLVVRDESLLPMPRSIAIKPFPIDPDKAIRMSLEMAKKASAIVTIEKVGPAADGTYNTGMGNDIANDSAKVDLLVNAIQQAGGLTIGIGDLGNEIGMGRITDAIAMHIPLGRKIACVVPTDVLVVGGCSNWGGYGVTAALAGLERNANLIHNGEIEHAMISACCRAGGADGHSTGPTMEVDGASWKTHAAFVNLLHDVVEISIDTSKPERLRFEPEKSVQAV
ncbi:hypothetical protein ANRL3_00140 [Anaerolineae bacterium]|nr:hypothetical protein ANRL3_00140 [Anaerolineae bacterium]